MSKALGLDYFAGNGAVTFGGKEKWIDSPVWLSKHPPSQPLPLNFSNYLFHPGKRVWWLNQLDSSCKRERERERREERKEGRAEILSKLIRMNSDSSFSCNIRLELYCGSGKFSGSINRESRRSSVSDRLPHPVRINRGRRCAEVECCFYKGCSGRKLDIHRGVSRGTVELPCLGWSSKTTIKPNKQAHQVYLQISV